MKLLIRATSLVLLASHTAAWNHITEMTLTRKLAGSEAKDQSNLIAFVWPEQHASKTLESEWDALQSHEDLSSDTSISSVDCSERLPLCHNLDVASFPAIRLYHSDGRVDRYRGPRTAREMTRFIIRASRPIIPEGDGLHPGFLNIDDVVFTGHFLPDDNMAKAGFLELAQKYRDRYTFGVAHPVGAGEAQQQSYIRCRNNVEDEEHTLTELWRVAALEDAIRICTEMVIPELTRKNEMRYAQAGTSLLHFFATTSAEKDAYRTALRPLAKSYRGLVQFTIVDVNAFPDMPAAMGLAEGTKTGLALQSTGGMFPEIYPYLGGKQITIEVVDKFLEDVMAGKAKPLDQGFGGMLGEGVAHDEL